MDPLLAVEVPDGLVLALAAPVMVLVVTLQAWMIRALFQLDANQRVTASELRALTDRVDGHDHELGRLRDAALARRGE